MDVEVVDSAFCLSINGIGDPSSLFIFAPFDCQMRGVEHALVIDKSGA
jgi:hypothetical protein